MKKWEKEIVQKQIADEQQVIYRLQDSYKFAIQDVKDKIAVLQSREQTQSVIYQLKYQQELQKQLENIYSKMSQEWYSEIDKYLKDCYEDGFFTTMYALHQEGIPIVIPFNQEEMAQMAAQSDYEGIKLSEKLYDDAIETARISRQEMTRGIASNESWGTIAKRIEKRGQTGLYNAMRITRTESHRITNEVKMKTVQAVKDEGADIVKQWDSTVDKRTRPHHVELDGQTREVEQPFKIASTGATAMYPGGFGKPEEDIHCRCIMLQRARWALDKSEIEKSVGDLRGATDEQLEAWAKKLGVSKDELIKASNGIIEADGTINHSIKAKNYNDFKGKYKKAVEQKAVEEKNKSNFTPAKTVEAANEYAKNKGVKYADYSGLPIETANTLNKALDTLPDDVRPVFVGASNTLEKYWGGKLPRNSKQYYGVTIDTFDGIHLGMGKGVDFDTHGQMVGISYTYRTADKIKLAKEAAQAKYTTKHPGHTWFFNVDGETTPFHEIGHVYANTKGLPKGFEQAASRWATESKCDMLSKPSEAWAEAWASYHTGVNVDKVPEEILDFIRKVAAK